MEMGAFCSPSPDAGGLLSFTRHEQSLEQVWKLIWGWKGMERIKIFLGLFSNGGLMTTNVKTWKEGI
jgi:hypothetical protein